MRLAAVLGLVMLVAPALAQAPDKACEGLDAVIAASGEAEPFGSFKLDWAAGKSYAAAPPPAGMEGAYECGVTRVPTGASFDCTWMFPANTIPPGTTTMAARLDACMKPHAWVVTALPDVGGVFARMYRKDGKTDFTVSIASNRSGGMQKETLRVSRQM